jgi:hypothetical protein
MMLKNLIRIGSLITLLSIATLCNAETTTVNIPDSYNYQVGWQYSRSASGFSLKIPIANQYFAQPIFAFGMTQNPGLAGGPAGGTAGSNTNGHFAIGLRGMRQLPSRGSFQPYTGIGWGHSENFTGSTLSSATITKGNTGLEAFLGVEYQKYILRPSLEIGLGSYTKADGSYYAGTTFNFALMYTF